MHRIRGRKALIHDAIDRTVDLVEVGHESSSRAVMRVLSQVEPVAEPARQIDGIRRVITSGVLDTVKGVNHLVAHMTDAGLDAVVPPTTPTEALVPLRSDAMGSGAWLADAAVGATNGVVGDHLVDRDNGLDLGMRLRTVDSWIDPDGTGIPADAGARIVLLIHGLATTEWSWCLDAERHHGDPTANFGTLLQADLDYTPVYARYNTGRHISENGRALAMHLQSLAAHWPVPIDEIVLLGHSMGGLVARSACHIAHDEGMDWVEHIRRVITIASPLQGAPLEKFGNLATAVLSAVDHPATIIPAKLINGRSAGIKDLRYGYVKDGEWQGSDPDAVAQDGRQDVELPPHIAWSFISATLAQDPDHPVRQALGDLMVRVASASGPADSPAIVTTHHLGGMHHASVQIHPQVYQLIRTLVATGPEGTQPEATEPDAAR